MRIKGGWPLALTIAWLGGTLSCQAATPEADPLSLQIPDEKEKDKPPPATGDVKFSIEGALGSGERRFSAGSESLRRLSADLIWSTRLSPQWRFVLSDRIDAIEPDQGANPVNSLRELYLGWQDSAAAWAIDAGRINLRHGPALGFNPTDFFRDGSVRVATTVNPILVREYRLGSVMIRAQRHFGEGSLALAVSPELADRPSNAEFSADLGSTNNRDRALWSLNTQWSSNASSQFHLYQERGGKAQIGASFSGLLGDATVAYAEGAWGRDRSLLDQALGRSNTTKAGRLAAGLTYSTQTKLSVSGEVHYNGFAIGRDERRALAAAQPAAIVAYLIEADRRQDQAARRAVLVYAKQTDAIMRNLDASVLLRWNADDRSSLAWIELRRRFDSFDVAAQWLRYQGATLTEFGALPYRTTLQVLVTAYF